MAFNRDEILTLFSLTISHQCNSVPTVTYQRSFVLVLLQSGESQRGSGVNLNTSISTKSHKVYI